MTDSPVELGRCAMCGQTQDICPEATFDWWEAGLGGFVCHRCSGLASLDNEVRAALRAALVASRAPWWRAGPDALRVLHRGSDGQLRGEPEEIDEERKPPVVPTASPAQERIAQFGAAQSQSTRPVGGTWPRGPTATPWPTRLEGHVTRSSDG